MSENIDILVTATDLSLYEVSAEFKLYVVDVLDIDNLSNNIQIFPNPSNGIFTIAGDDIVSIDIINIKGEIIRSDQNISQKNNNLDISDMPNGIYFIKINSKLSSELRKIIKN